MDELNMKAVGLEAKLDYLKLKVVEAKVAHITKFKESDAYKLAHNTTVTQFFTKERLKMKRL